MERQDGTSASELAIPSDLDAASVVGAHAVLLAALGRHEDDGTPVRIDVAGDGPVFPLSLQLLCSAARSFSAPATTLNPQGGRRARRTRRIQGDLT